MRTSRLSRIPFFGTIALAVISCAHQDAAPAPVAPAAAAVPVLSPAAVAEPSPETSAFTADAAAAKAKAAVIPGAPDRLLLSGTVVAPSGPMPGQVLIEGSRITCVAASCATKPGAAGATTIATAGFIFPGLIDAHNHALFNIFDEDDWKPKKLYKNHNLWTAEARYKEVVAAKKYLESKAGGVPCELDKYAEVKSLIAGTTSMVVAPGAQQPACFASVIRSIDTPQNDLGSDKIQSSISMPGEEAAKKLCKNVEDKKLEAYIVHTGEGIDETSRKEFDRLTSLAGGCLKSSKTTVVHGTALGEPEFKIMAEAKMPLVWSPKSNVFLYGETAKIDIALKAGVSVIALAPDWAMGGSVNLLDELRFADKIDEQKLGNILSPKRLFQMVTIDAARALGVSTDLGSIEEGKRADIVVLSGSGDPYDTLLAATPTTVALVVVDGRVLFGDKTLADAGPKVPGCETIPICGADKFLCLAEEGTKDKLDQTFRQVRDALDEALRAYDSKVKPPGGPLSPLAPLTKCSIPSAGDD